MHLLRALDHEIIPTLTVKEGSPMKSLRAPAIFLILVLLAAFYRFPDLTLRPLHCDEGTNADQLGMLLEHNHYAYISEEFHGPTLHYLSLISSWLQGVHRYVDVSEKTLRLTPVIFGVLLVAAQALLIPYIGLPAAAVSALLMAISPAMVYYSRYYIHEMLLVFFSYGLLMTCIFYARKPMALWAVCAGTFLGLMYATKETWIINLFSMSAALFLVLILEGASGKRLQSLNTLIKARHLLAALLAAIVVSALFLSSFLQNPQGLVDSITAYRTYFSRGIGIDTFHVHPWYFYLKRLIYFHFPGKPIWTEALILILAVLGVIAGFTKKRIPGVDPTLLRFFALYASLLTVIYSLVPYKTPWCLLGFLHLMIILGGVGIIWLCHILRPPLARISISALLVLAMFHMGWEAWAENFKYETDPCNPYVYAHTSKDIFRIVQRLQNIAKAHPDGFAMPIQVVSPTNLWPLPYYLRQYSNVGWWTGVSDTAPNAPVILATPDMEPALIRKLYELPPPGEREMYMNMFRQRVELRPGVEMVGYVAKSLWDDYERSGDSAPVEPGGGIP
jgi:uncharacterized protein (TIGR03663 family)